MLDQSIIKKIEDYVFEQPRSIQEIAQYLNKNWRTIDRYITEIQENLGTISVKVFRKETRGAIKIVYQSNIENISSTAFQKQLENTILNSKSDFSAFDIFQYVQDNKKKARVEKVKNEDLTNIDSLVELLQNTKKQLLIFSGNLSFINLKNKQTTIFNILEELVKKQVKIKILTRVDLAGKNNVEKMFSLNYKFGKENIEIKHSNTPVRGIISDDKIISIKEVSNPTKKKNELLEKMFIFYEIKDKTWIDWLSKIFWKLFNSSIDANKRLQEINKLL